jgi:sulfoxide reductase heme-binding subunit YedZ
MGGNWKKLHRWIYPASVAAVMHYFTQLKGNLADPLMYAVIIGLLLSFRVLAWWKDQKISRLMIPKRLSDPED